MDEPTTTSQRDDNRAPKPQRRKRDGEALERLCVVSRVELPVAQMIRFVVAPDGVLVADLAQRLPGRGVWVNGHRDLVLTAIKKGLFQRSLKRAVVIPPEFDGIIDRLLMADVRQSLSLANKAGLVASGFSKVEAELEAGRVALLISAQDARPDGVGKLARKHTAIARDRGRDAEILNELSSAELSLAIGGENVVHAAVTAGGQCRNLVLRAQRLRRFRTASTVDAASAVGENPADAAISSTEQIGTDRE